MNLENMDQIFRAEFIRTDLQGKTRNEAIQEIIHLPAAGENIEDMELLFSDILEREASYSTQIMEGIAIPHAKTNAATQAMVLIGKSKGGIDWRTPEDIATGTEPPEGYVHLMFQIIVPLQAEGNDHLKILALLARALAKQEFRDSLYAEDDPEKLAGIIKDAIKKRA